jgi:ATP-dependent Clp protease ATP-binding subunit ClpA
MQNNSRQPSFAIPEYCIVIKSRKIHNDDAIAKRIMEVLMRKDIADNRMNSRCHPLLVGEHPMEIESSVADVNYRLKGKSIIQVDLLSILDLKMISSEQNSPLSNEAMQERMQRIVERLEDTDRILFINNIEYLLGRINIDIAPLLKYYLGNKRIQVIGGTSNKSYNTYILHDTSLGRFFQSIMLNK